MNPFIDYTGYIANGFKVIDRAKTKCTVNKNGTKRRTNMWNCICDCGVTFIRSAVDVKRKESCLTCVTFKEWALSNGYEDKLTLDRKNVNGNYEPGNCKWATKKEQQANRRDNIRREFNGEMLTAGQICDITGNSYMSEYLKIKRIKKKYKKYCRNCDSDGRLN